MTVLECKFQIIIVENVHDIAEIIWSNRKQLGDLYANPVFSTHYAAEAGLDPPASTSHGLGLQVCITALILLHMSLTV